ncbi:MAG: hypothetical protein ACXVAX_08145 [Pseudobdellovibrio sp.]
MVERSGFSLAITGLLISLGMALPAFADINFASTVPNDQKKLIEQDLKNLDGLSFKDRDQEAAQFFKTPMTGAALKAWLYERSHYIVSEDFPYDKALKPISANYIYPNLLLPDFEKSTVANDAPKGNMVVKVGMSNIGSGAYIRGKQLKSLMGLDIPGQGVVRITSPRVGIFRVGSGLFMPLSDDSDDYKTIGSSIRRLMIFFHEARHSDGNGKSLTFPHAVCPQGHNLAGRFACDRNLNGPYTLGGYFLKAATEGCSRCREGEREALRSVYADSFDRVLTDFKNPFAPPDPTPTDSAQQSCDKLAQLKVDTSQFDACKGGAAVPSAQPKLKLGVLDDTPEKGADQ